MRRSLAAASLLLCTTTQLTLWSPMVLADSSAETNTKKDAWQVYTNLDLFAYSEPVSVDQFASDFDDSLSSGDTAFTHNIYEIGVQWQHFSLGYVHRFDYVTKFTEDTALVHHSEKNNVQLPQNRDYDLLLDVERLEAKGIKAGFNWAFDNGMRFDVAYTYYSDLRKLQSGKASVYGDLDAITDQIKNDAKTIIDNLTATNQDLSGLIPLAQQVNANILIDYAYDEPKFHEPDYQKPVILGNPNPKLSGVSFAEPDGTGHSIDLTLGWQVNQRLDLNLRLIDVFNRFNWDDAPQTYAKLDVNALLLDAINVAQDFADGKIVKPNDLIDRHLTVIIENKDFTQKLAMRADFEARYDLNNQISLLGWQPKIALIGGYYHTETKDFPRIGISLNDNFNIAYDIGGEALSLSYDGRYGFVKLLTDSADWRKSHTLGFSAGLNYSF